MADMCRFVYSVGVSVVLGESAINICKGVDVESKCYLATTSIQLF